ncbi:MAG: nickel/cobalt transporter (NicO) family protein [Actinomycetota bacterium]|nr:nickel/cobalt transporter (NicO) family protein [Actinomycetota bacterium]
MTVARKGCAVLLAGVALALLPAAAASAHPLGNFTVNTADRIVLTGNGVDVLHVVDLAEIPTVQARGAVTKAGGLTRYAVAECTRIAPLLTLTVDGRPASLSVVSSSGAVIPGAAGLTTTRLECRLTSGTTAAASVTFADGAVSERVGWKEVTLATQCGSLRGSDVPAESTSKLLTSYPADLLSSPLDVRRASADVVHGACSIRTNSTSDVMARALPRGVGGVSAFFTDFFGRKHLSLGFGIVSVLAAIVFGVVHALAPGHGKTVMAAYLVGQRGTRRQALQLGSIVTFTHTASVLALGALLTVGTLAAPERVVPLTEILSGLLLAGLGIYLLALAVRRIRAARVTDAHAHSHDHPHDHDDDHDHDTARTHSHGGGPAHSHAVPAGPLGWKTLAGMGVAGGLVPSPSALVVLLGATALGRAWFGVVLVVCYGLGMAVTLTAAGLLLIRAQAVLDRRGWTLGRGQALGRLLPVLTAAVVVLVGFGLVTRGVVVGRDLL